MNYHALLPSITSILFLFFGLLIYFRVKKNEVTISYLAFCSSIFWWLVNFSLMYWSNNEQTAFLFANIAFFGVLAIPVTMLHFVSSYFGYNYRKIIYFLYLLNIPIAALQYKYFIFYEKIKICFWGYYPKAAIGYPLVLSEFCVLFIFTLYLLFKNVRDKGYSVIKHQQIKYLFFSFAILSLGLGDYLTKFGDIQIYPFGYVLILIFVFTIALTIINFNLLDINLVLTRTVIWGIVYALILSIPLLLGIKTNEWLVAFIVLFILSIFGQMIARYFQARAEKFLLSEQNQYQTLLIHASQGMIDKDYDINKLSKLIVRILKRTVKIEFVILYLFREGSGKFHNMEQRGNFVNKTNVFDIENNSKIIEFIKNYKKPFFINSLSENLKSEFAKINSKIVLVIPSIFKDDVIGFILLGDKENKTLYSPKDLEVFGILSNQAALAIENCIFLEKTKQQQKRLFEAEKLASIGGMADGMAHQIRNRLNHFSFAAGMLDCEIEDFMGEYKDFVVNNQKVSNMVKQIKELSSSITSNVKKTSEILSGILGFAKTTEQALSFTTFSLTEIVKASILLVKVKHHRENLPIIIDVDKEDSIYGIKSHIQEVVFNCIDNSYEATKEKEDHIENNLFNDVDKTIKYVPEIKVSLKYLDDKYQIIIQDNGIGIKEENKAKIFSAFFTTKPSSKSGSGIGSYVAKRMIVEAHNGAITFDSKYGEGSTFYITLPMYQQKK